MRYLFTAIIAVIIIAWLVHHHNNSTPHQACNNRVLEVYTPLDVYYVNILNLEVTTEATTDRYNFPTLDSLSSWLSARTAFESKY